MLETQLKSNHTRAVIDTGCGNGWSSICDLGVAWALDVKHPRFLALCIGRTPVLSVKICVKECVLYARKYGNTGIAGMNRLKYNCAVLKSHPLSTKF